MPLSHTFMRLRAMVLLTFGARSAAEDVFTAMLARWPDDGYALASRAHVRAELGRRSQAIADLQQLVERRPHERAAYWFNLAYLLDQAERFDEAEGAFRRAVEIDPKLDRAWYGLGLAQLRLGRLDEAITALKRNTELQPMSPYGWTQLARAHAQAEQPGRARKVVEHLRGFEPRVAEALTKELKLDAAS
jgi:tetratricopeptide (TPR) repeat protein